MIVGETERGSASVWGAGCRVRGFNFDLVRGAYPTRLLTASDMDWARTVPNPSGVSTRNLFEWTELTRST